MWWVWWVRTTHVVFGGPRAHDQRDTVLLACPVSAGVVYAALARAAALPCNTTPPRGHTVRTDAHQLLRALPPPGCWACLILLRPAPRAPASLGVLEPAAFPAWHAGPSMRRATATNIGSPRSKCAAAPQLCPHLSVCNQCGSRGRWQLARSKRQTACRAVEKPAFKQLQFEVEEG